MVRLTALLPPEDAALVMNAIEAVAAEQPLPDKDSSTLPDPAEDPWAARKADALLAICEHALADAPQGLVSAPDACQLVVHVDVGVLTGEEPEGRCHLEDGSPISAAVAQRLGCDGGVVAITEKEGLPIDVGRSRRFFTRPQRRALWARDRSCRFPGCGVLVRRTHPHHLTPWFLGGATDLNNGASLCRWHHRRLHDGQYRILGSPESGLRFETPDGRPIEAPPLRIDPGGGSDHLRDRARRKGHRIDGMTPMALDPAGEFDRALVVEMLVHNHQLNSAASRDEYRDQPSEYDRRASSSGSPTWRSLSSVPEPSRHNVISTVVEPGGVSPPSTTPGDRSWAG